MGDPKLAASLAFGPGLPELRQGTAVELEMLHHSAETVFEHLVDLDCWTLHEGRGKGSEQLFEVGW